MTAVPFDALYDKIRPFAKISSKPSWDLSIRDAAREYCVKTKMRRVSLTQNILSLTGTYSLKGSNADEEVVLVEAAQYTNLYGFVTALQPIQPEQWIACPPNENSAVMPSVFWLEPPSQIVIRAIPQQSVPGGLSTRCIMQPTLTATTLDSMLVQMADVTIAYGALARLLRMNEEPWTSPQMADEYAAMFRDGINRDMTAAGFQFAQWGQAAAVYRY